jgi:hypothetical protein
MQLNVYVPRDKESVLAALDDAARRLGRQKNDLVIEAIETYLAHSRPGGLGVFHLGEVAAAPTAQREDLYLERWPADTSAQ